VQQQSQEQLDHAQKVRHEADTYRERVITEAKEQGQEILYLARSSAEQECNEMKRQAALEAQRTIAEAELIKAAAQEELEAQRIYAEAARLETESLEVLAQVRAKLGGQTPHQLSPRIIGKAPSLRLMDCGKAKKNRKVSFLLRKTPLLPKWNRNIRQRKRLNQWPEALEAGKAGPPVRKSSR
jgi:hypothetical protein